MPGWIHGELDARGCFRFPRLEPGPYTLGVGSGIDSRNAAFVNGVQVGFGEAPSDGRLLPLDLRGRWRAIEVLPIDEDGQLVDAALCALYADGRVEQLGRAGRPLILACTNREEGILVEADDFFPVRLDPFDGRQQVVLKHGLEVTLSYRGAVPIPCAPFLLRVALEPAVEQLATSGEQRPASFRARWTPDQADVPPSGLVKLRVRDRGVFLVRWTVRVDDEGYVTEKDIGSVPPTTIVVSAPDELPHEVTLDAGLLSSAVEELREWAAKRAR
ncbi:MAG: hypothetical protein HY812_22490 [Planctomycetes bacterium]|nr:hypothetical protein [Planctomycetota bacterium]